MVVTLVFVTGAEVCAGEPLALPPETVFTAPFGSSGCEFKKSPGELAFIGLGPYLSEPQARSAENSLSSSMDAEI